MTLPPGWYFDVKAERDALAKRVQVLEAAGDQLASYIAPARTLGAEDALEAWRKAREVPA